MKKKKIGFIGLGMMGKYMALNLLKKGYFVVGYNLSTKPLLELKKHGLLIAENPKEVAEKSEVIILMLPSSKETKEVIFKKDGLFYGLRKGQIVIDMSTSNPIETSKIMKMLRKKGVIMLDAPVSRGQKAAVDGTLSIMVGGDKKYFKKCLPIFRSMGEFIMHMGPFGSGLCVKIFNNFSFATNLVLASQGLFFLKKNKINIEKAVQMLSESSGQTRVLSKTIKRNLNKKNPNMNFYLRHMVKDVDIFSKVVKSQKIDDKFIKPILDFYQKVSKEHGNEDTMYVFKKIMGQGE